MSNFTRLMTLSAVTLTLTAPSFGQEVVAEAAINLTVQGTGPRQGGNGLRFMNIQGSASGTFASYGALEFDTTLLAGAVPVTAADKIRIQVIAANAAFTTQSGDVGIFFTANTADAFAQSNAGLKFETTNLPSGIGTSLNPLTRIGTLRFSHFSPSGTIYDVALQPNADVRNKINSGAPLRLLIAPDEAEVTATLSGTTSTIAAGATMFIEKGQPKLKGNAVLSGWDLTLLSKQSLDFELVDSAGATTRVRSVTLDDSGNYSFNVPFTTGTYDIFVRGQVWLRKKLGTFDLSAASTVLPTVTLVNGDIDGDNDVSILDYIRLSTNYEMDSNSPTWRTQDIDAQKPAYSDLDGDALISILDYIILSSSYGISGE